MKEFIGKIVNKFKYLEEKDKKPKTKFKQGDCIINKYSDFVGISDIYIVICVFDKNYYIMPAIILSNNNKNLDDIHESDLIMISQDSAEDTYKYDEEYLINKILDINY